MKFFLLFFMTLLIDCDSHGQKIGLYTVDMEYACECTSYRVFGVRDLKDSAKDTAFTEMPGYESIAEAYQITLKEKDKFPLSGGHSLVGVEINLVFLDKKLETNFERVIPYYNKCYVYYFEGRFKNKTLQFDRQGDQENEFIVENFKHFLRSPDCVANVYDEHP